MTLRETHAARQLQESSWALKICCLVLPGTVWCCPVAIICHCGAWMVTLASTLPNELTPKRAIRCKTHMIWTSDWRPRPNRRVPAWENFGNLLGSLLRSQEPLRGPPGGTRRHQEAPGGPQKIPRHQQKDETYIQTSDGSETPDSSPLATRMLYHSLDIIMLFDLI